jgi:rRNA maturation endonuclease Nob1
LSGTENCLSENAQEEEEEEEVEEEENSNEYSEESDSDVDDGIGWITPDNFNDLQRTSNGNCVEEKPVSVGCMTTDFAIQVCIAYVASIFCCTFGLYVTDLIALHRTY